EGHDVSSCQASYPDVNVQGDYIEEVDDVQGNYNQGGFSNNRPWGQNQGGYNANYQRNAQGFHPYNQSCSPQGQSSNSQQVNNLPQGQMGQGNYQRGFGGQGYNQGNQGYSPGNQGNRQVYQRSYQGPSSSQCYPSNNQGGQGFTPSGQGN
ncbi:hypothetical protein LINGRAHAP2_LOCUS4605, partial [Linum grandiflorum]